jgi:hypothetical protein
MAGRAGISGLPRIARAARAVALALLLAGCVVLPWSSASAAGRNALTGTATAHLHLTKAEGSQLQEEGTVSGILTGSARASLRVGTTFTASFTIRTRAGTITGHGQARPHGYGRYQSFSGSFLATHGTGRYAHISGHAGLYGVFDRRTESVVIQTSGGRLTY